MEKIAGKMNDLAYLQFKCIVYTYVSILYPHKTITAVASRENSKHRNFPFWPKTRIILDINARQVGGNPTVVLTVRRTARQTRRLA